MKKYFLFLVALFLVTSCASSESPSVLSNELKNNNIPDDITVQKSQQIRADFEKDLDGLYQSVSGTTH